MSRDEPLLTRAKVLGKRRLRAGLRRLGLEDDIARLYRSARGRAEGSEDEEHGHELLIDHLRRGTGFEGMTCVEVGSTREDLPGQGSTAKLARACHERGIRFVTVDMDPENTANARATLARIDPSFEAVNARGEDFLAGWDGPLELLYLDAFDYFHPHHSAERQRRYEAHLGTRIEDEACWQMHLDCARAVADKMPVGGVIVFDDVWPEGDGWGGKGKTAVPFLLEAGFRITARRARSIKLEKRPRPQADEDGKRGGGGRPRCSVVIRCRNEEEHIGRLLVGLQSQTLTDHEVIVVDSGSDDSTLAIAARFDTRVIHLAPSEFSFGRSLNLGCEAARGEHIVIVSAHCYPVYRDWLERMVAPLADEAVGVVYGKQRGADSTRFSEHRVFERWFPDEAPDVEDDHPFCNNANAAIRRTDWLEHPYDEELTGLEDLDWARGAIQRGQRIHYAPEAEVIHVHNETPRQIFNRYRREAIAFSRIFPDTQMSVATAARLFGAHVLNDARVALSEDRLTEVAAQVVEFRGLQMLGTLVGFHQKDAVTNELKARFYYPDGERRAPRPRRHAERVDYTRGKS